MGALVDGVEQTRFSPPLLTKTWFHPGPTGDEFAARGEADFTGVPAIIDALEEVEVFFPVVGTP